MIKFQVMGDKVFTTEHRGDGVTVTDTFMVDGTHIGHQVNEPFDIDAFWQAVSDEHFSKTGERVPAGEIRAKANKAAARRKGR